MVRMYIMFILAYSVVWTFLLLGYAESEPLKQNVTSIENTLDTLTHNVTELRKDVNISVDVLKLYLNQEAAFRNTLQHQLDNLSKNMTNLINQHEQDQYVIQQLQCDRDALREEVTILKHNNSELKLLYEDDLQQLNVLKSAQNNLQQEVKQISLAMVNNTVEIAHVNGNVSQLSFSMQQDRSDIASINKSLSASQSNIVSINKSLSASLQQDRSDIANINKSLSASLQQDRSDIAKINISLSASLQEDRSDIANINKSLSASLQQDRSDIENINKSLSVSLQQDRSDIANINNSLSVALQQDRRNIANINDSLSVSLQQDRSDIASINKSLSASLQQDRSDIANINKSLSAALQKEVTFLRQQFSSSITSVQSKLAQYIESGEYFYT